MIPIVAGALGTMLKRLVKGLEDIEIREQAETIQTTAVKITQNTEKGLGDQWRFAGTNSSERPSASTDVENTLNLLLDPVIWFPVFLSSIRNFSQGYVFNYF